MLRWQNLSRPMDRIRYEQFDFSRAAQPDVHALAAPHVSSMVAQAQKLGQQLSTQGSSSKALCRPARGQQETHLPTLLSPNNVRGAGGAAGGGGADNAGYGGGGGGGIVGTGVVKVGVDHCFWVWELFKGYGYMGEEGRLFVWRGPPQSVVVVLTRSSRDDLKIELQIRFSDFGSDFLVITDHARQRLASGAECLSRQA